MIKSIRYENFWPGFSAAENFLTRLFRFDHREQELLRHSFTCRSVFPKNRSLSRRIFDELKHDVKSHIRLNPDYHIEETLNSTNKKEKVLWYTGENIRPPLDVDLALSFDFDDYDDKNQYYPLLYDTLLQCALGDFDDLFGSRIEIESLLSGRTYIPSNQQDFCAFINNRTPVRDHAIQAVSKKFEFSLFGKMGGHYIKRKFDVKSKYRFILCFENDLYPGYITEKLLHAYALEAIPVYWGDLGSESNLNRRAFVQVKDFTTIAEMVELLSNLTTKEYKEIFEEPLFNNLPDYSRVVSQIASKMNMN